MIFRFNEEFSIDTESEPFRREGLRVGLYGAPGSTKSYTAAAFLVEPFLEQKGTIIIFQPRAEWHTLKSRWPDVQVCGGPYNQDVPFVAAHPKLYAEAVVEHGISLVFYTADVPEEEKLINFVDRFLDHIMRLQEKKHRPLMIVAEEAHEYAPLSPKGRTSPPWVFNRMVKRCKDIWTGGRKLNIVPVGITQRPQELHFGIRQLCNLSLFGQFAPQDISYIERECLAPYRKEGLTLQAAELLGLHPGAFLVIHHHSAAQMTRTVQRLTPHGADTPSLTELPAASMETVQTITNLGGQLQELLAQEKEEESQVEGLKRRNRELEATNQEKERQLALMKDLKGLFPDPSGASDAQKTESQNMLVQKLHEANIILTKQAAERKAERDQAVANQDRLGTRSLLSEKELEAAQKAGGAVQMLVESVIANLNGRFITREDLEGRLVDLPREKPSSDGQTKLIVDVEEPQLEVRVHREKVSAEESTTRGQIALLINDGFFDAWRSGRAVGRGLNQLGYRVSETSSSILSELDWMTRQRILRHDPKAGWMVANKATALERIVVKTA